MPEEYNNTPEGFMAVPANERFPIDAINCAKSLEPALFTKEATQCKR